MIRKILFSLLLICTNVYALDFSDKLSAEITDLYVEPYMRIDRGSDDGIEKGDVARLLTVSKVIGKGICVRVETNRSLWYVYKKYSDFQNLEKMMLYYRGNRSLPMAQRLIDADDLIVKKTKYKNKVVQHMEYIGSDAELYDDEFGQKERSKNTGNMFDDRGWAVAAQVSPISYASDSEELSYFFDGSISRTGKHNFFAGLGRNGHSFKNDYNNEDSKAVRTLGNVSYEIENFFGTSWSFYAEGNYEDKTSDDYDPIKNYAVFGPLGVKKNYKHFSFAYVPSFSIFSWDRFDGTNVTSDDKKEFVQAFYMDFKYSFLEDKLRLFNKAQVVLGGDTALKDTLRLEYKLGTYFSINYIAEVAYGKYLDIRGESAETALRQFLTVRFEAAL